MRIVCDTNVLVSGLLFGGNCRAVVRQVSEGRVDGFTSASLIAELEGVLGRRRFGLTAAQTAAIVDLVRESFVLVAPTEPVKAVQRDPDDNAVLETAVAAKADLVVSGDDHLLSLGAFRGIRVVSPARFLEEAAGGSPSSRP